MQKIGRNQMLEHMNRTTGNGQPHEFELIFVRGTGKLEGSLKKVKRCRVLGHASGHNHKERGTIPLYDATAQHNITPFLDNILFYNKMKVTV